MIDINIEFVRGVLIVRMEGVLNKNSVSSIRDNLITIIKNGGIKYLMFNIRKCVIEEDIDIFDECNKLIKNNNGKMYIHGLDKNIINTNYYTVDNIHDELNILRELREC